MVLSGVPRKKSPVTPPGIDPGTVRLVVQHLNHYTTPGPTPAPSWVQIQDPPAFTFPAVYLPTFISIHIAIHLT